MVARPAKANSSPSTMSITEGRRSRLRRIAMNHIVVDEPTSRHRRRATTYR